MVRDGLAWGNPGQPVHFMPKTALPTLFRELPRGWARIDGEASNAKDPRTFRIPTREEIDDLVVDDYVKIGIRHQTKKTSPNGERFWVKIIALDKATKKFIGQIDNDLGFLWDGIGLGDHIEFEAKHILSTHDQNQNFEKHAHHQR